MPYTLYYAPSACSLSPHIALREANADFTLAKVDLRNNKVDDGSVWKDINPKGYVPALRLPDGEVLTEGAVMVRHIADEHPAARLAPAHGTRERLRLDEWLHFIATELHKGLGPLYNSLSSDAHKTQVRETQIPRRFATLAEPLAKHEFLTGDTFTIADGYAYYVLRSWIHHQKQTLDGFSILAAYYDRLSKRPSIVAACEAEGISV